MPIENMGLEWNREVAEVVGLGGRRRGEQPVYFGDQIGIYTLEKNGEVIYVGKSGTGDNASINVRLTDHTRNNKKNKWNTFSWFGIRPVRPTGTLVETPTIVMDTGELIQDLEGRSIEAEFGGHRAVDDHHSSSESKINPWLSTTLPFCVIGT
jgi:hypothetical protein